MGQCQTHEVDIPEEKEHKEPQQENKIYARRVGRDVFYVGDITEYGAGQFQEKAYEAAEGLGPDDVVTFHITSEGGDTHAGIAMMNAIEDLNQRVKTRSIAKGDVSSAATYVVFACMERIAGRNTKFLLHLPSVENFDGNLKEIQLELEELQKDLDSMMDIYTRYCKIDGKADEIREWLNDERSCSVDEMIGLGLIDRVL